MGIRNGHVVLNPFAQRTYIWDNPMKPILQFRKWLRATAALGAAALVATLLAARADLKIEWSTIDGGGGTSKGGTYAVSGTIGQPDAGTMTNGTLKLVGGFWGVVAAVQNPPAPWLTVQRGFNGTVVVSWPGPEMGWRLHYATDLSGTPTWTEIAPPYATSGTNLVFIEASPVGNKFYRLHRP